MLELRYNTAVTVMVGIFVEDDSGVTTIESVLLSASTVAAAIKRTGVTIDLKAHNWEAISGVSGWYQLGLTAAEVDTTGPLTITVQDDDLCLPVFRDYEVVSQNWYDSKYGTSGIKDYLQVDAVQFSGISVPGTGGVTVVSNSDKTGYFLDSNQSAVSIGVVQTGVTVARIESGATLTDKTGYFISGTSTTLDALNDLNVGEIAAQLSSGVTILRIVSGATMHSAVTVGVNQDKTGYFLDSNQSAVSIGVVQTGVTVARIESGATLTDKTGYTVSTVQDKIGYFLDSNQSAVSIGVVQTGVTVARITSGTTLSDKTGYFISGTSTTLDSLNDLNAGEIIISSGVTVSRIESGATLPSAVTVTRIESGATLTDKTGYFLDSNQSAVSIGVVQTGVTVARIESGATLTDKTGYFISGTSTTLDSLNDLNVGEISTSISGVTDWTDAEKTQIRDALGISGTTTSAVSGDLQFIRDMVGGRWYIDKNNKNMVFFADDNATTVAIFALKDQNGNAAYQNVFERTRTS